MRKSALFIISFVIWWLLVWPYDFAVKALDLQSVIAGAAVSLLVALLFSEVIIKSPAKWLSPRRYLWTIYYLPMFFYYCIKANVDVAYRVLHPAMPIKPGIVKVKTTLSSDSARCALANSITLTPGTLTVDITDDGYLYIHWINVQAPVGDIEEASELIVRKFETILKRIFE